MGYWQCEACTYDGKRFIIRHDRYEYYLTGYNEVGEEISINSEMPEWFEEYMDGGDDIFNKSSPFACPACYVVGIDNFKWIKEESDFISLK